MLARATPRDRKITGYASNTLFILSKKKKKKHTHTHTTGRKDDPRTLELYISFRLFHHRRHRYVYIQGRRTSSFVFGKIANACLTLFVSRKLLALFRHDISAQSRAHCRRTTVGDNGHVSSHADDKRSPWFFRNESASTVRPKNT